MTIKSKAILRSLAVLIIVLGVGSLGLWFLSGTGNQISVKNPDSQASSVSREGDQFSDFGGKTPRDTLSLFIKALEKNNLLLAEKYFTLNVREIESEDLQKLQDANLLGDLIKSLKSIKYGKSLDGIHYSFEVPDDAGQTAAEIKLIKINNGLWKIFSL